MYIRSMNLFSTEGLRSPRVDRDIRLANGGQHTTCIGGRTLEGGVAVDGADA